MKSTADMRDDQNASFPNLYISKDDSSKSCHGMIVLMHKSGHGTVVHKPGASYKLGSYMSIWGMDFFEPYYGSVTIDSED